MQWKPFVFSLFLHVLLVAVLGTSLEQRTPKPAPVARSAPEVIQAVAVDANELNAEIEKLKQAERKRNDQEVARQQRAKREVEQAKQQREQEERRLAKLKKEADEAKALRQKEEDTRKSEEKKRKMAEQADRERLAALEKKRQAEQEQLNALEAQRKTEEKRRQQAEEQRKQQAEVARKREEAERRLQEQMAQEQKRLEEEQRKANQARSREQQRQLALYKAEIRNKVERNWLRPARTKAGTSCTVLVHQLPGGDVVGVKITRSSGDAVFDRSVENAVRKASPLPAPSDAGLFDREIEFVFEAG